MALAPKQGLRHTAAPAAVSPPATTAVAPAPLAPLPVAPTPLVKVRCIVHTGPFTHLKRLDFGEVTEVPEHVAALMLANKQVEKVS